MRNMRIATWNVNSVRVRVPLILEFLKRCDIDVLLLQELKCMDEQFPRDFFDDMGYSSAVYGQKTYNGVAIVSRYLIEEIKTGVTVFENDLQARYIEGLICGKRVASVYTPNGQDLNLPAYEYKLNFYDQLARYLLQEIKNDEFIIGGDFNVARTDLDVYNPKAWKNKICCSDPERQRFQNLVDIGLFDMQREMNPESKLYTWWDYRHDGFKKNNGLRLDYILTTSGIKPTSFHIDLESRAMERPSDHAAVIMEIL